VPVIEAIRFAFLGSGLVNQSQWLMSLGFCTLVFGIGLMMFNRAEQTVMDTV
jgi:ABC-type polysaccharide/polyol phosphate export permease